MLIVDFDNNWFCRLMTEVKKIKLRVKQNGLIQK